jgi:hypothetical protein
MPDNKFHDLEIGESVRIKRGLMTSISLVYAGMPNDGTFSVAVTVTAGHMGMGYNLYFPIDHRQFALAGIPISVQAVSPASVQLTVHGL